MVILKNAIVAISLTQTIAAIAPCREYTKKPCAIVDRGLIAGVLRPAGCRIGGVHRYVIAILYRSLAADAGLIDRPVGVPVELLARQPNAAEAWVRL